MVRWVMLSGSAAKAHTERLCSMFVKRVGNFMKALLRNLNADTFTPFASITDPVVANELIEDALRTVRVMEAQQHIEVQTNPDGSQSLRLTPSGVALLSAINGGAI